MLERRMPGFARHGALGLLSLALLGLFPGCAVGSDSGACVTESNPQLSFHYTYCSDDWDEAECEAFQPGLSSFRGGETCESLGYDYYCASSYTYHMSSGTCYE